MSDAEILVSTGETSDSGQEIVDSLPTWMPTDEGSGNFKLLDVVGRAIDRLDSDIESVDDAKSVQSATSIAQIEQLARLVNSPPRDGETLEKYRARTMVRFAQNTSEGTIGDVINGLSAIFDTDAENFRYQDWKRLFDLKRQVFLLPYDDVKAHPFKAPDLQELLNDITAAAKTVEPMWNGDLVAWSAEDYEKQGAWDTYADGADGLDAEGNPTGEGGTPAGLIE
ncbi:P2 gpI-like phage tail protein [Haloarcula virus HCTV-15]|nr:P2 gpI-like phage tail protein [Haloarcula virus HCTV-6]UBF22507.1 P2 gpI-like phage tail protein [Haloarcula virus HCTV-15]